MYIREGLTKTALRPYMFYSLFCLAATDLERTDLSHSSSLTHSSAESQNYLLFSSAMFTCVHYDWHSGVWLLWLSSKRKTPCLHSPCITTLPTTFLKNLFKACSLEVSIELMFHYYFKTGSKIRSFKLFCEQHMHMRGCIL